MAYHAHVSPRLALAVIAALAACKGSSGHRAAPRDAGAAAAAPRDRFIVAHPQVTVAPVPARFAASPPSSVAALADPERLPPAPMLRAGIAAGDAAVQQRVLAALRDAARAPALPQELTEYYRQLFGGLPSPEACAWARAVGRADEPAGVRAVFLRVLVGCPDRENGEVLLAAGAPPGEILDWAAGEILETAIPWDDRIVAAARAVARTGELDDVRKIGFAFARMGGDRGIAEIKKLQREVRDPQRRSLLALGMQGHASPAGKALARRACEDPALADDPMCAPDEADVPEEVDPDPTKLGLDEQIEYGVDVPELLARFPRAEVVAALQRAASSRDGSLATTLRSLREFPDHAALERYLVGLGFTLPPPAPEAVAGEITPQQVLMARGLGTSFDVETDRFPNEHDGLLAELAHLARPALDGALFEEVPPRDERGPYLLRAYLDGKRYELRAENHGDWYDLDAVIGLLDALLITRGSEQRFLVVATGDQTATVVAGPAAGLRALVDAKFLEPTGAAAAMDTGKALENEAVHHLERDRDQDY